VAKIDKKPDRAKALEHGGALASQAEIKSERIPSVTGKRLTGIGFGGSKFFSEERYEGNFHIYEEF
jgi:hypothetical protein